MSALQEEIKVVVEEANRGITLQINDLLRKVDALQKDAQPEYVSVKEAAKVLKVCEKTIHKYCSEGRFEVKRLGGKKLISYESLIQSKR